MTLSEFKNKLSQSENVVFELPNGKLIPSHFHVTEIGQVDKTYIDCGGVVRSESKVSFQLWEADDFDHRLTSKRLLDIIKLSEIRLGIENLELDVEYQGETIGRYGLGFNEKNFVLTSTSTDCLAKDNCGVSENVIAQDTGCCSPESGCC
ncbi:MAG: hypothetical protein HRT72_08615 [Flavobacteriales bacterium]|nr:hypothetical protein [Flavobacteriales bacterium]